MTATRRYAAAMTDTTFTYQANRFFIRQVVQASIPPRLRRLNLVVAGLAALVVFALLEDKPWVGLGAGIGGLIAAAIAFSAQKPLKAVQQSLSEQFDALPQPAEISVTVSDAGLRFTNANGSKDVAWAQIESIHQTRAIWFLHTIDGSSLPMPAAAIPQAARDAMTEHVATITNPKTPRPGG